MQQNRKVHIFDNGLTLLYHPKNNFTKSFAGIFVNFGAKDCEYEERKIPLGVAHFLEHKMFEKDNGEDYMALFSKYGAMVNAYTSYNETFYYFETSGSFQEPFKLLLDLISDLNISEESIEKEKGIILEEYSMTMTHPETKIISHLYKNMYQHTPVKFDILGTRESISSITFEDLKFCFKHFYQPNNLTISVASETDFETIIQLINNHSLSKKVFSTKPVAKQHNEPQKVVKATDSIQLDIQSKKTFIGYKLKVIEDYQIRRKFEFALQVIFEFALSSLNPCYQQWLDDKKINDYFGGYYSLDSDYALCVLYNESEDVAFLESMYDELLNVSINEKDLNRYIKRYFGSQVRIYDEFYKLARYSSFLYQRHHTLEDDLAIIRSITIEDIYQAIDYLKNAQKSILNVKTIAD